MPVFWCLLQGCYLAAILFSKSYSLTLTTQPPAVRQVLTSTKDIEMWGDGKQTRSFTYIDDCVEGILRITKSDFKEPLNLGSSEMVECPCHSSTLYIL